MQQSHEAELQCTCGTILTFQQNLYCENCLSQQCVNLQSKLKRQQNVLSIYTECLNQYQAKILKYNNQIKQSGETQYDSIVHQDQILRGQIELLQEQLKKLQSQKQKIQQQQENHNISENQQQFNIKQTQENIYVLSKKLFNTETILQEELLQKRINQIQYQRLNNENILSFMYEISFEDEYSFINGELITYETNKIQKIGQIMNILTLKANEKGYKNCKFIELDSNQGIVAVRNEKKQSVIKQVQLGQWRLWLPAVCDEMEQLIQFLSKKYFSKRQIKPPYKISNNGYEIGGIPLINQKQNSINVIKFILYDLKHIINMYYFIDCQEAEENRKS